MSSNAIIKVEGLSKHYLINKAQQAKSDTLYGSLINTVKNVKQKKQNSWTANR